MMVALLLYADSRGLYSSRRIAQACEERVDFMAVTAMNQPDFRTGPDWLHEVKYDGYRMMLIREQGRVRSHCTLSCASPR